MRHGLLWMLALLAMPAGAAADNATGPAGERSITAGAVGSGPAEPPVVAASDLDLRLDPAPLRPRQASSPAAIAPERADRGAAGAERGLAFGLELRPLRSADSLARTGAADEPGIGDDFERLIDRSTLGLRGKYRF